MFKFTSFTATDVAALGGNQVRLLIISRNDRYLVYTATRRRFITGVALRGDFTDPTELITDNNLIRIPAFMSRLLTIRRIAMT